MRRVIWGAIVAAILVVPGARAVSATQTRPPATRAHVVAPGDSLWTIARSLDPGGDPRALVERISALNGLRSSVLQAGQTLRLPMP